MSDKSNKPKSPPTPSRSLGDSVADVRKLYDEYSHGTFAKPEIASKLGLSATSGPFGARLFTLKAYGLLDQSGSDYKVSEAFKTLNSTPSSNSRFKATALAAVRGSDTFREVLDEFKTKLPSVEAVAQRLETQKRFNAERAKMAASVLEKSLGYAGVLDSSNNILPIRETPGDEGSDQRGADDPARNNGRTDDAAGDDAADDDDAPNSTDMLRLEIPVGDDRMVLVRYPHDLTSAEAKKVGNVLNAVVS